MRAGFSLVELSIVLVILGLLTGGILAGQSLIRAAEVRAVTAEAQRYTTAFQTFRDKYFAIPGDMKNATKFWGQISAVAATCKATPSNNAPTCDGDGNGYLSAGSPASYENERAWQHLANAGLIEGVYTGVFVNFGPGEAPSSKMSQGLWYAASPGLYTPSFEDFAVDHGNELQFYAVTPPYNIIKPEEAWNIDTKMDDGRPGSGKIISWKGDATHPCTSMANNISDANAVYQLSNANKDCWLYFTNVY